MKTNSLLRAEARKSLSGKWGLAAVITLVFLLILGASGAFVHIPAGVTLSNFCGHITGGAFLRIHAFYPAICVLVMPVLGYGLVVTFLKNFRSEAIDAGTLFIGFRNYFKVLGPMLLVGLYTFLWTLLFIVPGIVKAYSYAMTAYILHDDLTVGADEAIERSKVMMKGYKAKLFLLDVSFIGWGLLCVLTLGIGFLWLLPYMQTTRAAFYEEVRNSAAVA